MNDIRKNLETISSIEEGLIDKLLGRAVKSSLNKPARAEPSKAADETPDVFFGRNDPRFTTAQQRGQIPKDNSLPTRPDIIAQGERRLALKSAEEETAKKAAAEKSRREFRKSAAAQKAAMDAERKAAENSRNNAIIKGINQAKQPANAEWTGRTQEYKGRTYNVYRNREVDAAGNHVLDATGKPKYERATRGGDKLYYAPASDERAPFRTVLRRTPTEVIRDVGPHILKPTPGRIAAGALGTAAVLPNIATGIGGGIIDAIGAIAPSAVQNIANVGSNLWNRTVGTSDAGKPNLESNQTSPAPPQPVPRIDSPPPPPTPTRVQPDRSRNL